MRAVRPNLPNPPWLRAWYSIIAQAVVDHGGLFRDLCIGWPGSVHDAHVFSNSKLYSKVNSGELLQCEELRVMGGTIPVFLIGDSAYPLLSWRFKPFSHSPLLPHHHKIIITEYLEDE